MSFGKLIGNRYTVAGFIGGALAGSYDVATNRRTSAGEVLSDMAAGAGLAMLGTKGAGAAKRYFEKFEMGALAEKTSNRTVKENAIALGKWGLAQGKRAKDALVTDVSNPMMLQSAAVGAVMSGGMKMAQGDADLGDVARAGAVGALTGAVGFSAKTRLTAKHAPQIMASLESGGLKGFLKESAVHKTLGITMGIGGAMGAIDASIGRQENSPMGGAVLGAMGGAADVGMIAGLVLGAKMLTKNGGASNILKKGLEQATKWHI